MDGANWVEWNHEVIAWIDGQLITESDQYVDKQEWYNRRNIFFWMLFEYDPSFFELKKQFIKYGAPGTGKTFTCLQDVNKNFLLWKGLYDQSYPATVDRQLVTVQFHPSYTYEDFLEGIRPVLVNGKTELKLVNGIFKTLCKTAAAWEMDIQQQIPELSEAKFERITVSQIIGKLKGDRWKFLSAIKQPETTLLAKVIPPFYLIIDEINRAELSRVLGELMFCLEYRGYKGKIKTQYSSLVANAGDETAFWYENGSNYFFIPHNVIILGTMNNIDRSVESFDFALRRRFNWIEVEPDYSLIVDDGLPEILEPMVESLKKLNDEITKDPLLGKDYRIGHSYFMGRPAFVDKLSLKDCKKHFWVQNIKPLLEEYLRGSGENNRMEKFANLFFN